VLWSTHLRALLAAARTGGSTHKIVLRIPGAEQPGPIFVQIRLDEHVVLGLAMAGDTEITSGISQEMLGIGRSRAALLVSSEEGKEKKKIFYLTGPLRCVSIPYLLCTA